ncbi:DUF262 domain-containing protein [Vibrio vulnificus]|uniref:DUF262 domain-containing protein n=1 Tax=Vibrio vulnificus TaxID=672 RepID=UPI001CDC2BC0|nr:DUF262 domain-containing protein [Vibrio vulnificus]EJL7831355.1 DUF262 domain-containing protein [Vibrio vulnificus]MCA3983024.1 DUF262 domain-containing protein [Vibrio vulnificus]MDK2614363.1 DUF262 domain-containing protein [Vibrio vulnificus]MDK2672347.1 DUF262 domain-containing protein [Vibrio vulnificus]
MSRSNELQKLEEQIYAKRREVRYDMRDLTVEYISDKYADGIAYSCVDENERKNIDFKRNILYVPEYQREFTWDEKRSSKLIESILLGLPIPFIFVAENDDGAWEIVDGSQRIRTIHAFVNNELKLSGLQSLNLANGCYFDDLDKGRKGKFLDTALRLIILSEETSEDVKKDMFERINRGSDLLKAMEKRKGIYTGEFTKFIYKYVESNKDFNDLLKVDRWLENRQEKQELLLRFFALSENNAYEKGISGSLTDYLDRYLEKKNLELAQMDKKTLEIELNKYKDMIDSVVQVVKNKFPYGFRHKENPQTKRSVFEAVSVGTWLAIKNNNISSTIDSDIIFNALNSSEIKKYTHTANQIHKKEKLVGRIEFIRDLLTRGR